MRVWVMISANVAYIDIYRLRVYYYRRQLVDRLNQKTDKNNFFLLFIKMYYWVIGGSICVWCFILDLG